MPIALPDVPGVRHTHHDLPTGVRVHVAEAGPADGQPVLCLHGWPQHWLIWRGLLGPLGERHRVICPDLRGHGWSGWPEDGDFRKARLADDALSVLDALGIERADVIGHDWGGWTGLLLGITAPERVRSLLALSVLHPWQPRLTAARNAWRFAYQLPLATPLLGERLVRTEGFIRRVVRSGWSDKSTWDEESARSYEATMRTPEGAKASHRLYRTFVQGEIWASAGGQFDQARLAMPTRLLIGEHDPLGAALAAGIERRGDDAAHEVVPGAGHFLPEERPAIVAERALALLA